LATFNTIQYDILIAAYYFGGHSVYKVGR